MASQVDGNLDISGNLVVVGSINARPRSELLQDNNARYMVPLATCFVWDSGQPLPSAAASDDLTLNVGTYGTNTPNLSAGDCKTLTATRRARFTFVLPPEYVAGESVTIRANAGVKTTVADGSCTVDFEAYKIASGAVISGSDLVTTSATSINSTTFSDKDFTVTPGGLSPGDRLDIRVSIAVVDTATATAVTPTIADISLLLDVKG